MTTDPLTAFVDLLADAVAERVANMQPERGFEGPMMLSIPEAAKRAGVGSATMRDWVRRKIVPVVQIGGKVMIRYAALEQALRLQEQNGHEAHDGLAAEGQTKGRRLVQR